ncbi:hypothetical protein [Oryzomonas sagensis]|uniref:hypothetical protein n=1 Tax=Oryzomonas sagensis TaxID=2603857 RepID=UPI0012490765|nr:hypothetical protein [Oryzomonas sagensis]
MEMDTYRQCDPPFPCMLVATKRLAERELCCDSRYRSIIDQLDAMFGQLLLQPDKDLGADFDHLLDTVLEHVGSENISMGIVGFPQAIQHGLNHQFVCLKTAELRHRIRAGQQVTTEELGQVRQLWLKHIETYDHDFEDFLAS